MAAVAARFVAHRNHDRAPVRNALDLALKNPEFGRINQIIGGVDRQKLCLDFFQIQVRDRNRVKLQAHRARRLHHQS